MSHVRFPDKRKPLVKALASLHNLSVEQYLDFLVVADATAKGVEILDVVSADKSK